MGSGISFVGNFIVNFISARIENIKKLFGNTMIADETKRLNGGDTTERPKRTGGSANVLKVSQEEFSKLVDKILKGSDSGFKKLYEMSKLIKLDAKEKKIIEVLANSKNMAIIAGSLFGISYTISYLLKKPAKKVEKQFAENTNLTKGNMKKIENTINKEIKKAEEKEKTKSQIKTLGKSKSN
jgi:hypothetical protein